MVFRLLSTIYKDNGFATQFGIIELIICKLADDSLSLQCKLKPLLDMKSRYLPIMIVAVLLLSGCCSKQSKIDYIDKVIGKLDFNINPNAEYGFRSDFVDSFKLLSDLETSF